MLLEFFARDISCFQREDNYNGLKRKARKGVTLSELSN